MKEQRVCMCVLRAYTSRCTLPPPPPPPSHSHTHTSISSQSHESGVGRALAAGAGPRHKAVRRDPLPGMYLLIDICVYMCHAEQAGTRMHTYTLSLLSLSHSLSQLHTHLTSYTTSVPPALCRLLPPGPAHPARVPQAPAPLRFGAAEERCTRVDYREKAGRGQTLAHCHYRPCFPPPPPIIISTPLTFISTS